MFDILGFKALRARKGTADVAKLYECSLLAMIQHAAAGAGRTVNVGGEDRYVPHVTTTSAEYRVISDTVIFLGRDDTFDSFCAVVNAGYNMMSFGLSNGQTPFRGAIGFGDLYDHDQIVVGSAIEDAYAGEMAQSWAGAMFTEEATRHATNAGYFDRWVAVHQKQAAESDSALDSRNAQLNADKITWYDVPLKEVEGGSRTRHAPVIDWTLRMFEGAIEKALPESSDPRCALIRQNSLDFERWARAKRQTLG